MKTLIVKYLPNSRSITKKLLEAFLEGVTIQRLRSSISAVMCLICSPLTH